MKATRQTGSAVRGVRRGIQSEKHRAIFDAVLAAGWRWRISGGTHVLCYPPAGGAPCVISTTATEGVAKHTVAVFRRAGLRLGPTAP